MIPEVISQYTDRPVIDKTGLKADEYYCLLDGLDPLFSISRTLRGGGARGGPPSNSGVESGGASIFTLVEQKYGMKLEPRKGSIDVLVIDRVDRPSEN
jgi:uncharacterized protein (TIGR03435 family)